MSAVESEEVLTLMNDLDCFFNLPIRTERRALSLGSFVKIKKRKKRPQSSSGVIYEEYCILNELVKCAFIHTLQQQQQQQEECASSFDDNNRFFGVFTL